VRLYSWCAWSFLFFVGGCTQALSSREVLPEDPSACAPCHQEAFDSWRASRHSKAFIDPIFTKQFNPRRWAWCVECHAPIVDDPTQVNDEDERATQGVGCLACHAREGTLVSRGKSKNSPHQTQIDESFGAPVFCGGCHDFNFPILGEDGRQEAPTSLPMQETLRQFQRSQMTSECIDCHTGHRFVGATEPTMIRDALRISGCVKSERLYLSVENIGAAHNIPTGGIDRHLWLTVWRSSAPEGVHKARIGRTFRPADGGGKEVVTDNTIAAGGAQYFMVNREALRGSPEEPLNITLRYVAGPERDRSIAEISWDILTITRDERAMPTCPEEPPATLLSPPTKKKKRSNSL
jgi:hypothetical protein